MLDLVDCGSPEEQQKHQPVFTEDETHELKKRNVRLQHAKERLRKANASLQELFLELSVASARMEKLHRDVGDAQKSVLKASRKPFTRSEEEPREGADDEGGVVSSSIAGEMKSSNSQDASRMARSQLHLRHVTDEHRLASQALMELQTNLSRVNLEVQNANAELQQAFRDMRQAERYEFMLAHQDQTEIRGAFVAITGQEPTHWKSVDSEDQERREKAERSAVEAQAACCPRDEIHSLRRARGRDAPPQVPALVLPLLPQRVVQGAASGAVTDRPTQAAKAGKGGFAGFTPRIVCRGGMTGQVVCTVAFNDRSSAPRPPIRVKEPDVRLPALPTRSHALGALAHQPLPKSLLHQFK